MGMGVVERGHEQTSRAIVGLAEGGSHIGRGRHRADIGDSAVAHPHPLVVLDSEVSVENVNVAEEHGVPFKVLEGHVAVPSLTTPLISLS